MQHVTDRYRRPPLTVLALCAAFTFFGIASAQAQHTGTSSGHEQAQQACKQDGQGRGLAGSDLDDFVRECTIRAPTSQLQQHQQRVTWCDRRAHQTGLQGDRRTRFIDECLKDDQVDTADHDRLAQCIQQASRDDLRGEAKKTFIDKCTKA